MEKSTTECRKGCDVYADWEKLELENARLIAELEKLREKGKQQKQNKTKLPSFKDITGLFKDG